MMSVASRLFPVVHASKYHCIKVSLPGLKVYACTRLTLMHHKYQHTVARSLIYIFLREGVKDMHTPWGGGGGGGGV